MDLHARIGSQIKQIRTQVGLSQAKVADLAGVSVEFVSRVERGRSAASVNLLGQLASAMGVPLKTLLDFAGDDAIDLAGARAARIAHVVVGADEAVGTLLESLVIEASKKLRGK